MCLVIICVLLSRLQLSELELNKIETNRHISCCFLCLAGGRHIAMMPNESASAQGAAPSTVMPSVAGNWPESHRRQRKKRCSFALGFGSNYFGALGVTVPPPLDERVVSDLAPGGTLSKGEEQEADAPYQWGHVSFLTLGQEDFRRQRQRPATSSTSAAPAQASRSADDAIPPKDTASRANKASTKSASTDTKRRSEKGNKSGGGGGGLGFTKGFLLSSSKRKKRRNKRRAAKEDTNEPEPSVPMAPSSNKSDSTGEFLAVESDHSDNEDGTNPLPASLVSAPALVAVGSTHTVYCFDDPSSPNGCTVMQSGTIHGRAMRQFVPVPMRVPLRCLQLSCGKRHVLALMGDGPGNDSVRLRRLLDGPIVPGKGSSGRSSAIRSAYDALSNGIVMSWGAGHFGQLGLGPEVTFCPQPTIVDELLPRAVGGPVIHVCAGPLHSAAIVATSATQTRSFLFGSNRRGQCGMAKCNTVAFPRPLEDIRQPEEGTSVSFVRISLGRLHGVGLTDIGELYSWGSNTNGRLGHGDCTSAGAAKTGRGVRSPSRIDALKNVSIIQVAAGDGHTLALTGSGRIFAWGSNSEGQLGQAHTMNYNSPRLVGDLDFAGIYGTYDEAGKLRPRKAEGLNVDETTSIDAVSNTGAKLGTPGCNVEAIDVSAVPDRSAAMIPKIISVCASGDYSAALSSYGDVYSFGYGGGNQMGHCDAHPSGDASSSWPYVEPGPKSRTGAGNRVRESCSFDSQLNVLLPRRVELTRHMGLTVDKVCMGPSNMIMLCSSRTNDDENMAGMTLYEIESRRRSLGLSKLGMLSAKKQSKSKQTDGINNEDLKNDEAGRMAGESISSFDKRNDKEDDFANGSDRKEKVGESKIPTSSRGGKTGAHQTEKKTMLRKTKNRVMKR